jgi:hypothetical protein
VKYKPGFYIAEDGTLHGHRRENLKSYTETMKFLFAFLTAALQDLPPE